MVTYTDAHHQIRQYLLGNLSKDIQQQVEERLLVEDSFFEELLFSEEELMDDYINGELSADDRLKFEQHFLSTPERQQKLRFALALSRYASHAAENADPESAEAHRIVPPDKPSWAERFRAFWSGQTPAFRAAVALSLLAIIAGTLWLSLRRPSPRTFATLTLTISVNDNRGAGVQASKVPLALNADALKISLKLPARLPQAARYRVELVNANGETKPLEITGQDAQSVSVVIRADELARGQYALKLFATHADGAEQRVSGSYFFTVE
jgi:anti-sigma-K factor RskA